MDENCAKISCNEVLNVIDNKHDTMLYHVIFVLYKVYIYYVLTLAKLHNVHLHCVCTLQ